ncbi:MAG: hypothetical protein ACI4XE_07555, partial [Acutalibacteraceae bacterium]
MKKFLAILLAAVLCLSLAACGGNGGDETTAAGDTTAAEATETGMSASPIADVELKVDYEVPEDFKIGFICLHDEKSTYDLNFLNAVDKIKEALKLT